MNMIIHLESNSHAEIDTNKRTVHFHEYGEHVWKINFDQVRDLYNTCFTEPLNDEELEKLGFTEEYNYWHFGDFKLVKEDDGLAFSHNGKLIQYTHELIKLITP